MVAVRGVIKQRVASEAQTSRARPPSTLPPDLLEAGVGRWMKILPVRGQRFGIRALKWQYSNTMNGFFSSV